MPNRVSLTDVLSNPNQNNLLAAEELHELFSTYPKAKCYTLELDVEKEYFEKWRRLLVEKNERRGEVALFIENDASEFLLHTKPFYPQGIYRVPTGGIHKDESVLSAMNRELLEETGFQPVSYQFHSLLIYDFRHDGDNICFPSYAFHITPDGSMPIVSDENEQISGFSWASLTSLHDVVKLLFALRGSEWEDWGKMRAAPHEIFIGREKSLGS